LVAQVRNEKRFHRQAQEEIRILEHLRKQDPEGAANVVRMLDTFTFRSHICITFELLSMNLYELIKKNKFQVASQSELEMWANAQRDGRPAEYRWRSLFNAAKFG